MTRPFKRRDFLLMGSAVAGSLLIKSCGGSPSGDSTSSPSASTSASPVAAGDGIKVGILHFRLWTNLKVKWAERYARKDNDGFNLKPRHYRHLHYAYSSHCI